MAVFSQQNSPLRVFTPPDENTLLTSSKVASPPASRQLKRIGNIWEDCSQWQPPSETPSSGKFPEEEGNRPPG